MNTMQVHKNLGTDDANERSFFAVESPSLSLIALRLPSKKAIFKFCGEKILKTYSFCKIPLAVIK